MRFLGLQAQIITDNLIETFKRFGLIKEPSLAELIALAELIENMSKNIIDRGFQAPQTIILSPKQLKAFKYYK